MKKILTMLVTAVMLLAVFGTFMPFSGTTEAASSNSPVTMIANRWNLVGYDRYGCRFREGKLVPWEKQGIRWWGRQGFAMPYALWAVDDLPNAQPIPPATARYAHNVQSDTSFEAVPPTLANALWSEVWLTVVPDNGKSTYLDHWYVIIDTYGQVWFDPDGTFNDCRYYGYADPYDVLYRQDAKGTHDNCTDNPLALCDPIISNNTQGPYIFDPDYNSFTNPATVGWLYHSENYKINNVAAPEFNNRIYFWDAANPKEKRIWKLGWADMNDYLALNARGPRGVLSSGLVYDFASKPTTDSLCNYKDYSDWDLNLALRDFTINMSPTGNNNAINGSVLHTENISYPAQFPDSVAAPIAPHATLTFDFGEFVYEKAGTGPAYAGMGPNASNRISHVDEGDVRRTPVVVTRNTTMVMSYPGGSAVADAGNDGVYQPGDDYDVGVSLWAFSDGTFPPGAAYPERYHDQVISGVTNNIYDTGEFIYREINGNPYTVNGYTRDPNGNVIPGDVRLSNVNGWQDNVNDHDTSASVLRYDTDGKRRAGIIDGDLLLMAEVTYGGCISPEYDIAIESDAWIGWRDAGKWMPVDPALTAAGIRSHFDTTIQHMNRVQKDAVLAEKTNEFFVPATVFQNVKWYERQFMGWTVWLDDGIDNNQAVNNQYTSAVKALDLSHNLEGYETMEQTVGAYTLSKWDLDYNRGDSNDYIGALVAFADPSKIVGPPYGFYDTNGNGFGAGEKIYRDMDYAPGSPFSMVTVGDIRCSSVITYRNNTMVTYGPGTVVAQGDLDIGIQLDWFTANVMFYDVPRPAAGIPRNNQYDPGEDIYYNPSGQTFVNYRSIRLTEIEIQGTTYHSGSVVQMGRVLFVDNRVHMISVGNNGNNFYMDGEVIPGQIQLNVKIDAELRVEQTSHIQITANPAPRKPGEKIYVILENLPRSSYNNIAEVYRVIDVDHPVINLEITPYRGSCDLTGFVQDRKVYIHAFQETSDIANYKGQLLLPKDGPYIDPFWLRVYRDPEKRAYANYARYVFDPVNDARYKLYEPLIGHLANSYDCYARFEKTVEPENLVITANRKCLNLLEERFPNVVLNLYNWDNPNDVNDPGNIPFATQSIPDKPHRVNYNARGAGIKFLFTANNADFTRKYIVQVNDDDTFIAWEWVDLEPLNMLSPLDSLYYRDLFYNGGDQANVPYTPDPRYGARYPTDAEPESEAERCSVIDIDCSGKQATCDICGEEQGFIPIGTVTLNDLFSNSYVTFNIQTYGVPTMVTDYGFLSTTDPGGQILVAVLPRNTASKLWIRVTAEQTIFNYNSINGQLWPPNGPSFLNDYTGGVDYCGMIGFEVSPPDPDVNFVEMVMVDHALQYSRANYTAGSSAGGYRTDPLHKLARPAPQIQNPYNPILYDYNKELRCYPGGQTHPGRLAGQRSMRKSGFNAYPAMNARQFYKLGTEFFPLTDYGLYFFLKNIRGEHLTFADSWNNGRNDLVLKKVIVEGPFIRPKFMNQNLNTYLSNNQYNGYQYLPIAYDISGKLTIDSTNSNMFTNHALSYNGGNFSNVTSAFLTVADPIKSQIIYPTDTQNPQIPPNDYLRLLDRSLDYSSTHLANIGPKPSGAFDLFIIDEIIPINYGNIKITVETVDGKRKIYQDCCNTPPTEGFNVWGLDIQNAPAELTVDQDNTVDINLYEYESMQVEKFCNDALVFCWQDRGIRTPGYQEALLNGSEPPRLGAGDGWITNPPKNSNNQDQMWQFVPGDDLNGDGSIKFVDFETEILGTYDMATNTWKTGVIDARTFQRNDGAYKFELTKDNGCQLDEIGFDFGGGNQIGGRFKAPDHVIAEEEELPLWITAYKYGDDDNDRSFRPYYEIPPTSQFGNPGYSHEVYLAATKPIKIVGKEDLVIKTTPEILTAGVQSELVNGVPFTIEVYQPNGYDPYDFVNAGVKDMFGFYKITDPKYIWNNMFKDPHPDDTYYYGKEAILPRYYWLRTDLHNNDGTNKNNNYFFSASTNPFSPIVFSMKPDEGKYSFERFVANDEGTFPVYIWSPDRKHRGKLDVKVRSPKVEYQVTNADDPDQKVFTVPAAQGDTDFLLTAADNRLYKVKVICRTQDGGQLIKGAAQGVSVCQGTDRDVARFTPAVDRPMTFAASTYGTYSIPVRPDIVSADSNPGDIPQFETPRVHPRLAVDLDNNGKIEDSNREIVQMKNFRYAFRNVYIYSYYGYYYFYYYPPQEQLYPVLRIKPQMYYRTENYGYTDPKTGQFVYPMYIFADIYASPETTTGWGPGAIYNSNHKAGYCFADLTKDSVLNFADSLSLDNNGSTEFWIFAEDVCSLGGLVGDNIWSNNMAFADVYGGINAYLRGYTLTSGYYFYGSTTNFLGEEWAPNFVTRRYGMRLTGANTGYYIPASDDSFYLDWDAFPSKENYLVMKAPKIEALSATTREALRKDLLHPESFDLVYSKNNHVLMVFRPADPRDLPINTGARIEMFGTITGGSHERLIYGRTERSEIDASAADCILSMTTTGVGSSVLGFQYNQRNTRFQFPYEYRIYTDYLGQPIFPTFDSVLGLEVLVESDEPLRSQVTGTLNITVRIFGQKAPAGNAEISIEGAGVALPAKKCNDKGQATVSITPTETGIIKVKASLAGHLDGVGTIVVGVDVKPPTLIITDPSDMQVFNTPTVSLTGETTPGATVTVNGNKAGVGADGKFKANVNLQNEGPNTIVVKATSPTGAVTVAYLTVIKDTKAPEIIIDMPKGIVANATTYTLTGRVEPGSTVTVNGQPATVVFDIWSATVSLVPGENQIKIVAQDPAGNQKSDMAKINNYKATVVEFVIGNQQFYVNDVARTTTPAPSFAAGTFTVMANEDILAALGFTVTPTTGNVYSISYGSKNISVSIGSKNATDGVTTFVLPDAPVLTGGRLVVPIHAIVRSLGEPGMFDINYNDAARRTTITLYQ